MSDVKSASDLVRETKARIDETRPRLADLTGRRAALALSVARGEPEAVAESARIRGEIASTEALVQDLTMSLEPLKGFAQLEQAAADVAADRQRQRQARKYAVAHVRAAEAVDKAVLELAKAMRVADQTAALAHDSGAPILGRATSALTTQTCADAVLGQLVRFGALERIHLPTVYTGELGYVQPLAAAAQRHAALIASRTSTEAIEAPA
jgi:hypothetical protein